MGSGRPISSSEVTLFYSLDYERKNSFAIGNHF
jgi:hypothetical protein